MIERCPDRRVPVVGWSRWMKPLLGDEFAAEFRQFMQFTSDILQSDIYQIADMSTKRLNLGLIQYLTKEM
jgi:hypothetical protein